MSTQTTTTGQEAPATGASCHDPEEGLRELTGRDYIVGAIIGTATAALLVLAGRGFAPAAMAWPLAVAGFGMGFLGYLDQVTRLIRNGHTIVFGAVTALVLAVALAPVGISAWIPVLATAAGAFVFLLVLSAISGFAGGGDIKLSPVPAAVLAACFPLTAVLWLLFTFVLVLIGQIAARAARSEDKHAAMAPLMAAAMIPAVIVGGAYQHSLMFP
ncbi:MAG TPA: hypothetical protein VF885_17130 [Arthrobacter sp.]